MENDSDLCADCLEVWDGEVTVEDTDENGETFEIQICLKCHNKYLGEV